jgi:hypothetical protein
VSTSVALASATGSSAGRWAVAMTMNMLPINVALLTSTPQYTIVALANPLDGAAAFFRVRGLNFGLVASVQHYSRRPALVCFVCNRLFATTTTPYVDDLRTPHASFELDDLTDAAGGHARSFSPQGILWTIHEMMGFRPLSGSKYAPWSQVSVKRVVARAHRRAR